jgi:hypothetical protein
MHKGEIVFYEGEKRELTATVHSEDPDEVVVIASAEFELRAQLTGEVVQSGVCEVNDCGAVVFLDLAEKGSYELKVTTHVGREDIVDKHLIRVV